MESGDLPLARPVNLVTRGSSPWAGPAHPVARGCAKATRSRGFIVLETPGHSPGHLSFWREADRTLVAGDVLFGRHRVTGRPGLHEPPEHVHPRPGHEPRVDPPRSPRSTRRSCLRPRPAVRDPTR